MACTSRTTFVLERDEEGRVTEAFTPDFYLPEQDLYLEVTVMKQSLVTRKNRKLRKLRAALSRGQGQALLRARLRAARGPLRAAESVLSALAELDERIGEVYLDAAEIAARVRELGAEIARDYAGREPLLVGSLKACIPFVCDLSRAIPIHHTLDFVELAGYGAESDDGIRFLKDLERRDRRPRRRDRRRGHRHRPDDALPRPLALAPRARRRCTSRRSSTARTAGSSTTCPFGYVGFTIPDEFFVGYGFDLDERYRNLPDLHLVR